MAMLIERDLKIPKYLQLAEHLRQQIAEGHLSPHERLPSFNEMKERFDATQHTVEKAHALLESDGLIRREHRRGVFVNDPTARKTTDFVAFLDYEPARHFSYFMEVHRGVREYAQSCGKSIAMVDDPNEFKHWKMMGGVILERGGYFLPSHITSDFPKEMPMVRLHYSEPEISSVMSDDASGIAMAMQHLLDLGHRRIGYLVNLKSSENYQVAQPILETRYHAYLRALQQNGIVPEESWVSRSGPRNFSDMRDLGYEIMQEWLCNGWKDLRLTAMLAQNDAVAIGMIRALEGNGISVPGDVSIVGFDGFDTSTYAALSLTTVVVPLHQIGMTAMRVLIKHIDQPNRPPEVVKIPVHFHVGESTAPPKQ